MLAAANIPPISAIIITFGLVFVITAALANGLSVTFESVTKPLKERASLTSMVVIGNFVIVPAIVIGFLLVVDLGQQFTIAFALLAFACGAPFVAWITSLGKGNIPVGASLALMLTVLTWLVLPLALPGTLRLLDTGVSVSVWKLAWPLLAFITLPLVLGMAYRARHPQHALHAAAWLGPVSFSALLVHVTLMFVTYWHDFTDEFGTGQIAVSIAFPLVLLAVGFLLSPPYVLSPVKPANQHRGSKLAASIATAQRGTQAVICSLIFAFAAYPVAGVVALASSVITLVILVWLASELGRHYEQKTAPVAEVRKAASRPKVTA